MMQKNKILHLITRAKQDDREAIHDLGYWYFSGVQVDQDYTKAVTYFQRAAEMHYPHSQFNLAVMYENGWGLQLSLEEAEYWYLAAAHNDFIAAQYN